MKRYFEKFKLWFFDMLPEWREVEVIVPGMFDFVNWGFVERTHQVYCKCGGKNLVYGIFFSEEMDAIGFYVVCKNCGRQSTPCVTREEALKAWNKGECLTPIPGTSHYEEAW